MTIRAVCFDADGVVVYPQKQFAEYLRRKHAISPEMTEGFFGGVFNDCLIGAAALEEVLPPFLKEWGWKDSVDVFIRTWLIRDHVVDARLTHTIQGLRHQGVICCLATSQERNRAEYMRTEMNFQQMFDRLFFSCEIGWQKPQPAYYGYIEKDLGLPKDSILLWDDCPTNVAAARELGWNAEIYTDFREFEERLKKYVSTSGLSLKTSERK